MNGTIRFTSENWLQGEPKFLLSHTFQMPLEFEPMIQIYMLAQQSDLIAILVEGLQVQYIAASRTILIYSLNPFDGYFVIR